MTKQEALHELMDLSIDYGNRTEDEIERLDEAVDMAIAALRADAVDRPTCEDAVSRHAAIDALMKRDKELRNINWYDKPFAEGECKGIDYALEIVNALPSVQPQRWIPCSERLPEEGQDILAYRVFGDEERIIPANYGNGCWFDCHMNCSVEHIIAWMPLPEPYKERRTDE